MGTGAPVLAAGAGTVVYSGTIAGRGVVVIRHAGGLRTTYEPVSTEVAVGRELAPGEQFGSVQPAVQHCAQGPCLHWGALVGDLYLDPLSLLTGPRRPPVLLPLNRDPK
jgi:murein DD-endopeptidase MepM/ murein hydrolase activator NlpD